MLRLVMMMMMMMMIIIIIIIIKAKACIPHADTLSIPFLELNELPHYIGRSGYHLHQLSNTSLAFEAGKFGVMAAAIQMCSRRC